MSEKRETTEPRGQGDLVQPVSEKNGDCVADGLSASVWVKRGVMLVRRDYLDPSDPGSWESLWFGKFGNLDDFPFDQVYESTELRWRRQVRQIPTSILRAELMRRPMEES